MLKPVIVATAALAIAGSSLVYAQQRYDGPGGDGGPRFEHRHRPSAEDMAAYTDARIAALKAGLELTPDQAKNWPAFEQALRDMAQLRMERMKAREARQQQGQNQTTTPMERLSRRADNMVKVSAALKHIADTGTPLYKSLNDGQKERFTKLARMLRPHHHHARYEGEGGHRGWGWREGNGYGRDGGNGGQWWGHHNRRSGQDDNDQSGGMHRMMDTGGDQDQRL